MNGDAMKNTTQRDERNKTRSFRAAFAARDRAAATPGFAIQILRDTDLGIATLIVEDEEGHYDVRGGIKGNHFRRVERVPAAEKAGNGHTSAVAAGKGSGSRSSGLFPAGEISG